MMREAFWENCMRFHMPDPFTDIFYDTMSSIPSFFEPKQGRLFGNVREKTVSQDMRGSKGKPCLKTRALKNERLENDAAVFEDNIAGAGAQDEKVLKTDGEARERIVHNDVFLKINIVKISGCA